MTRATRNDVIRIAHGHGAEVRCIFFDTPPHEAEFNVVPRMIARFGGVLDPAELAARSREDPAALAPQLGRPGIAISLDATEEAIAAALTPRPARSHAPPTGSSTLHSARIPQVRRSAGAALPCPGSGWRSPIAAPSMRARACSARRAAPTVRSPARSACASRERVVGAQRVGAPASSQVRIASVARPRCSKPGRMRSRNATMSAFSTDSTRGAPCMASSASRP